MRILCRKRDNDREGIAREIERERELKRERDREREKVME